jgi:hypothetical protein
VRARMAAVLRAQRRGGPLWRLWHAEHSIQVSTHARACCT